MTHVASTKIVKHKSQYIFILICKIETIIHWDFFFILERHLSFQLSRFSVKLLHIINRNLVFSYNDFYDGVNLSNYLKSFKVHFAEII